MENGTCTAFIGNISRLNSSFSNNDKPVTFFDKYASAWNFTRTRIFQFPKCWKVHFGK